MSDATVFGRAWVFDYDDLNYIETWEHEFEPTEDTRMSGSEWANEHLRECYSDKDLRKLFELPPTGNFQVLFKGTMHGFWTGGYDCAEEWDEEFNVEECKHQSISEEYVKGLIDSIKQPQES